MPEYQTIGKDDWKNGYYADYKDPRSVDETLVMMNDPKYKIFDHALAIPGYDYYDYFQGSMISNVQGILDKYMPGNAAAVKDYNSKLKPAQ